MDSAVIISALGMGALFVADKAAGEVVKDAYRDLRARVADRLARVRGGTTALARFEEEKTAEAAEPLQRLLDELDITSDSRVCSAARQILGSGSRQDIHNYAAVHQQTVIGTVGTLHLGPPSG